MHARLTSRPSAARRASVAASGAAAAEYLLRRIGAGYVHKALDPTKDADFVRIVARLTDALRDATEEEEAVALALAMDRLDVDWAAMTPTQTAAVVEGARQAVLTIPPKTLPVIDEVLESSGPPIMQGTRGAVRERFRLNIKPNLATRDDNQAEFLRQSTGMFVKDQYRHRADVISQRARDIAADGLDKGLGSREISRRIGEDLAGRGVHRSKHYWDVVSSAFVNRARTAASLGAFDDAGVERYVFEAVLDERTTEQCRFLHGKTFSVRKGLERLSRMESIEDPEDIKHEAPWVTTSRDEEGNKILAYKERDGSKRAIARVDEPGYGERDRIGRYSNTLSADQLQSAGISHPPLHGLCRSVIVPDV